MKSFVCVNCGREFEAPDRANSHTKYCPECKPKIMAKQTKEINKARYINDPEFRKDMIRRTLEWQSKHPERHWARTAIMNHRMHNFQITFSIDELENLALKTRICRVCGILLNYNKKGSKGFKRDSPSMENINRRTILRISDIEIICAQCNSAKSTLTPEEFAEWVDKVHFHIFPDNERDANASILREEVLSLAKQLHIKKEDITNWDALNLSRSIDCWKLRTLYLCAYDSAARKLFDNEFLNRKV